ncbi:MAG: AMP-binding protein, partial [Planctomycetota bacterium]|nr:AMP-binding protein [Planctomycetota bacterium]
TDLPVFFVDKDSRDSSFNWRERVKQQSTEFDPVIGDPHDPFNILFSSGTTGKPKAIPWNQTTPIKCAMDGHLHHDLQQGDVVAWPTNLGWMMGPWLIFATLINKGVIAIYEDSPMGSEFGQFVQDARVNMLGLVPSIVRLWKRQQCMEPFDWSAIKTFSSTGEASNSDDMFYLSWLAGFKPIIEYCGGTEIGGGYISSTVVEPNVPAAFSTPAFGLDVQIVNENFGPDEEGELFITPPSIGLSIELLNRDHQHAYYQDCPRDNGGSPLRRHGDFFKQLGNGYFVAGGRTDDTMNLGGIKVSSIEIEQAIDRLPQVAESAAVAVPLDRTGPDQLVVFYVPQAGYALDAQDELMQEMNQAIRAHLNPLFKVRQIVSKETLPRTASNKVMRRVLRQQFLPGSEINRKQG